MQPLISVCIPSYEDGKAVERAILCLKNQTLEAWECVIGDDSHSDTIKNLVVKFNDIRIRYIQNVPPLGVPNNWNFILSKAKGKYVTLLHQDDFYPDKYLLEKVVSSLEQGDHRFAVCAFSSWEHEKRISLHNHNGYHIKKFLHHFPHRSLVINRIGHPSTIFIKKELTAIMFDTKLRYFLDTDWYARLWLAAGVPLYINNTDVAIEKGRNFQLSRQCIQKFSNTSKELQYVLNKWNASPKDIALNYARLFTSHIRHYKFILPSLKIVLSNFSLYQKIVFLTAVFSLSWHMIYRFFRKKLGYPWG